MKELFLEDLLELKKTGKILGEFKNISNDTYHDHLCPGTSKSDLDLISRSFDHYTEKKIGSTSGCGGGEGSINKAFQFGTAFHELILEPHLFEQNNILASEKPFMEKEKFGRKKADLEAKQNWLDTVYNPFQEQMVIPWEEKNEHKVKWKEEDWQKLHDMKKSCDNSTMFQGLMKGAEFENTYFWEDEKTGIIGRCRPDIINKDLGIVIDLKSTVDASYNPFRRAIGNYLYDKQASFYLEGVSKALGKKFDTFIFVAVEKTAPFGLAIYNLDEASIDVGRELWRKDLDKLKSITHGEASHGYPDEIQQINLPNYCFDVESR